MACTYHPRTDPVKSVLLWFCRSMPERVMRRENEQGMAHFVEHLIFKGTEKRKAWHILNRMEGNGGDLNAYTNKEETVVYAAFLNEHLERGA